MAQRDILQSLGNLASIGNYFKLKNIEDNLSNIEGTLNAHNRNEAEQNNLRNIVFNFKKFFDITFLQINDSVVKSYELLRINEYLKYYSITADSFNSFLDKEYFSHFYQRLKEIEYQLKLDESSKLILSNIDSLISTYEALKYSLLIIRNRKEEIKIISGKRFIYATIVTIILFLVFFFSEISLKPAIIKFLILLPWAYVIIRESLIPSNKLKNNEKQIIEELGISSKLSLDSITDLLERKLKEYKNKIKEIFSEHNEFSITQSNLFKEINLN